MEFIVTMSIIQTSWKFKWFLWNSWKITSGRILAFYEDLKRIFQWSCGFVRKDLVRFLIRPGLGHLFLRRRLPLILYPEVVPPDRYACWSAFVFPGNANQKSAGGSVPGFNPTHVSREPSCLVRGACLKAFSVERIRRDNGESGIHQNSPLQ